MAGEPHIHNQGTVAAGGGGLEPGLAVGGGGIWNKYQEEDPSYSREGGEIDEQIRQAVGWGDGLVGSRWPRLWIGSAWL